MAITKEKKKEIVDKLTQITKAPAMVFVSFKGLPVVTATALRRALSDQGTKYFVTKKTLLRRALSNTSITGTTPELPGEMAVAYGDDALTSAKSVYDFEKKTAGQVKIVGGVYEGAYADAALMTTLATIPGREVLYAQFLNLINSPIQGLAMALNEIAKKK